MAIAEPTTKHETVTIRDVGPHTNLEIHVAPGVTVLAGPNEIGKSLAIRCVAALAGGDGKSLPIRDGAAAGMVTGFGTTLMLSSRTNRSGELEVDSLDERQNIATLIDPGLKDPAAAMRKRIRALLTLTGRTLDWSDFTHILPEDHQDALDPELAHDDPVEMAGRIKRHLQKIARHWEDQAGSHSRKADAILEQLRESGNPEPVDPETGEPCAFDEDELRRKHREAVSQLSTLEERARRCREHAEQIDEAEQKLKQMRESQTVSVEECELALGAAEDARSAAHDEEAQAAEALAEAQRAYERAKETHKRAWLERKAAAELLEERKRTETAIEELQAFVTSDREAQPTALEIERANRDAEAAEQLIVVAAKMKEIEQQKARAEEHRAEQAAALQTAEVFRAGARATDDVLTGAVQSSVFRVHQGELQAQDRNGVWRRYATPDLSDGALCRAAIVAVAEARGQGKLCVAPLDQMYWEGLDAGNRKRLDETAKAHNVAIVTAEVMDSDELHVYRLDDTDAVATEAGTPA